MIFFSTIKSGAIVKTLGIRSIVQLFQNAGAELWQKLFFIHNICPFCIRTFAQAIASCIKDPVTGLLEHEAFFCAFAAQIGAWFIGFPAIGIAEIDGIHDHVLAHHARKCGNEFLTIHGGTALDG